MKTALFRTRESDEFFFHEGCHIVETLNDAADPACSIVRARVDAGVTTRWHRLTDTWERYAITSGHGRAYVGDEAFDVSDGDVVLIPPGVRQRIRNTGSDDLVFLAICTPPFRKTAYIAD